MTPLPAAFTEETLHLMGDERFERYLHALREEPAPVSIRLHPQKCRGWEVMGGEQVPWCSDGWYLPQRPNFTFDPLLHAGCYYVQEAASMFLAEVIRQFITESSQGNKNDELFTMNYELKALDLCAAPGGKSTLLRAMLPEGSILFSNEPVRSRASVLAENMAKWGYDNCWVTNNYPRDYRKAKLQFDLILCDVPCSGEGMFRKDAATIGEWSPQQVEHCWRLQREIVSDAWECLAEGGLMIYSTCTFNTHENEENIRYFQSMLGAEVLPVETKAEWGIVGSLLSGFDEPIYRFIPGITRSEGLFVCVLRRGSASAAHARRKQQSIAPDKLPLRFMEMPSIRDTKAPTVELSYEQTMSYLRHEALTLPADAPRGVVNVSFGGHTLGLAKNIGQRANNLYPKEWRIKTTHIPNEYEAILRHT